MSSPPTSRHNRNLLSIRRSTRCISVDRCSVDQWPAIVIEITGHYCVAHSGLTATRTDELPLLLGELPVSTWSCVGVRGIWLTPWATLDRLWLATDPLRC